MPPSQEQTEPVGRPPDVEILDNEDDIAAEAINELDRPDVGMADAYSDVEP